MSTSSQILESVQASARELEADTDPAPEADYGSYGHVIDLGAPDPVDPEEPGFIKDPQRRREPSTAGSRAMAAKSPVWTQHVTVTLPKGDLKPGSTIRIVLDIKTEP